MILHLVSSVTAERRLMSDSGSSFLKVSFEGKSHTFCVIQIEGPRALKANPTLYVPPARSIIMIRALFSWAMLREMEGSRLSLDDNLPYIEFGQVSKLHNYGDNICYICMHTTESFALLRAHISSTIPCNQPRTSLLVASTKDLSVFSLIHLGSCFVHDCWVTVCCFNCHLASAYSNCSPFVSLLLTSDNLDGCFPVISAERTQDETTRA
jgi:hypothetical protein